MKQKKNLKLLKLLKIQVSFKNSSYSTKKEPSIHLLSNPSDPCHFSFLNLMTCVAPRTRSGCRDAARKGKVAVGPRCQRGAHHRALRETTASLISQISPCSSNSKHLWAAGKEEGGKCQMEGERRLKSAVVLGNGRKRGEKEHCISGTICSISNRPGMCTLTVPMSQG